MLADEYQRLAMQTTNRTANDTDERRIVNTALGLIGESGEIADSIGTNSRFVDAVLSMGAFVGQIADMTKKAAYQGHDFDPETVLFDIGLLRDALNQAEAHIFHFNSSVRAGECVACERLSSDAEAHITKELGDIAWYTALGCESIGASLSTVLQGNIDKLRRRYPEGFSSEASKHRSET